MTKVPNPPPAGAVKPDPPPAPPRRRAPWPAPPKPWPRAPPPPERDHGTRFDVYAPHPDGGELSPPQGGTGTRYPGVQPPEPWPEPEPVTVAPLCMAVEPAAGLFRCTRELGHAGEHFVSNAAGEHVRWPQSVAAKGVAATAVPDLDSDLLAALRSALAEGVGVEELLARVRGEGRPWTFCADALPREEDNPRLYEVATLRNSRCGSGEYYTRTGIEGYYGDGIWSGHATVYAWRPHGDPPPPRPADRQYLIDNGVPPEWLGAEED